MKSQQNTAGTDEVSDTRLTRRNTARITDSQVRSLQPPSTGNRVVFDDKLTGFGVRITAKGSIAFVLNYSFKGRERRITIGRYPTFTVLAARKQCEQFKLEIAKGLDPLERKQSALAAPTVQQMWERYERDHLPKLAVRSGADQRAMFTKLILPAFGKKKVTDVTFSDCEALHRRITRTRPTRANRVIEVLRRNFNLAMRWGWTDTNPAEGIERNPEEKRERYLTLDEVRRLLAALHRHPQKNSADAIAFMLLTGCRRNEALAARWEQFSPDFSVWTKPAATTKQRRTHRVPISAAAQKVLDRRHEAKVSEFVFVGAKGKALTDVKKTWASVSRQANISDVRLHDLRHTFASIAVSQGLSLPVVGALLGHTQAQTTLRYAHLDDQAMRSATNAVSGAIPKH